MKSIATVSDKEAMRFVTIRKFQTLTGITPRAVYGYIAKGVWLLGKEFHKPTKAIVIDLEAYNAWVIRGAK